MRIAIQGEQGSFHDQVAKQQFGDSVSIVPASTFSDVFRALDNDNADMAIVAVENSLYGSINEVLDLLESHPYPIVGEVFLRIEQQLISLPGTTPEQITKIYSHPVALAQCEAYLDAHFPAAQRIEYHDTAASVEYIKNNGDPTIAAIAGRTAAALHELPILAENIEDNKANFTRFLIITKQADPSLKTNKTSLVITTDHTPGALSRVLSTLAEYSVNVTKLQSRPIIGQPWKYRFYLDIEVSSDDLAQIITTIQKDGPTVTVLGSYIAASL
jgi:prephenate dehydratase